MFKVRIRVGTIVKAYPEEGKAIVCYDDLGSTSQKLPLLTFNDELSVPETGDMVVTLHMTDTSQGFILGTYWTKDTVPPYSQGISYVKRLGTDATVSYNGNAVTIESPEIILRTSNGEVSVSELVELLHPQTV